MLETEKRAGAASGTQTLARGIDILLMVAAAPEGVAVQEVAQRADLHRTAAYRLLQALVDARLLNRRDDGRYYGAVGLLQLASVGLVAVRDECLPVLRRLADQVGATVSVQVAEGDEAVTLAVAEPRHARYRITFTEGSRYPLDRAAGGHALSALQPHRPGENPYLETVRAQGWARSFAEVEPGAYGVAVPVPPGDGRPGLCVDLITFNEATADAAVQPMIEAAREIAETVRGITSEQNHSLEQKDRSA